jgi:hypothetical protein
MGVKHFDWGQATGGLDDSGGFIPPLDADYGNPVLITGTLGGLITTITLPSDTKAVTIRNTSDSNSLQYSYDGLVWLTLGTYGEQEEPVCTPIILLRAVAGTPTYEVLAILTE